MGWECFRCGEHYDVLPEKVICRCGYRVFIKVRQGVRVVRDPVYCPTCGRWRAGRHPHNEKVGA